MLERDRLQINDTGEVVVLIDPDGLPAFWATVPTPMMSEIKRAEEVQDQIDSLYLSGYFVTSQKRAKNPAFDSGDEMTTTKIQYRACKNQDEALLVVEKVKAILEKVKLERSGG